MNRLGSMRSRRLMAGAALMVMATTAQAQQAPAGPATPAAEEPPMLGDIVVTARRREESLMSVPVSVTAMGAADLQRYKTDSLDKVGEMTPGLVIGQNKSAAGGSIAVRGVSTSATSVGFEQAVLVNIDGVPVSNGRVVAVGFFDLNRVEVLKGPQALLFGKNNTAGVISLVSADPTDRLEGYARAGYEFVADEIIGEGAISGPIGEGLGARLAFRGRKAKGWMYNDAQPLANPFAPAYPTQVQDRRLGDGEISGRVTLKYKGDSPFSATLKVFGSHGTDDGSGTNNQVVGCDAAKPRIRNVIDPYGECRRDNRTTAGDPNPTVLAGSPSPKGAYGFTDIILGALTADYDFGQATLTSTTGYLYLKSNNAGNNEVSSFAQLYGEEPQETKSFSQELRLLTDFDGAINVMVGGFYQDLDFEYEQNIKLNETTNFNPATGQFIAWIRPGYTYGKTYSAFGQVIFKPAPKFEITGGARYTRETKNSFSINTYTFQAGFPQGKSLSDRFKDSNISPEVSVSYHPTPSSTIYGAYKTGFKSGGFALSGTIQTATLASDLAFGSERAEGFEAGAKGRLLGGKLRLEAVAYTYKYKDLQVTTFNPTTVSYTFSNAASLKQRGLDVQGMYQATPELMLRAAVNYNRNRFGRYLAQCYGGQTAALGCNVLPGPSQDLTGRAPARSPDWSGNAGISLDVPISDGLKVLATGDAFYTARYYGSDTLAPSTVQNNFWRFNAGIRLAQADDRWDIGVVGRNLTNKYYLITAQDKTNQAGDMRGSVSRGREILLQVGTKF